MLTPKFIKKYMRLAAHIGQDQNPCYSRQIGVVIVDPVLNRIVGTGYNGPPPGTPHTDTEEYLREFFWPQLTDSEKESIGLMYEPGSGDHAPYLDYFKERFIKQYSGCRTCPRRLVNAGSGERTELCSCGHAERHAITNAACPLNGAYMFAWCPAPCLQCTDAIIHAGIKKVYCLIGHYHKPTSWLMKRGNVELIQHHEDYYLASTA